MKALQCFYYTQLASWPENQFSPFHCFSSHCSLQYEVVSAEWVMLFSLLQQPLSSCPWARCLTSLQIQLGAAQCAPTERAVREQWGNKGHADWNQRKRNVCVAPWGSSVWTDGPFLLSGRLRRARWWQGDKGSRSEALLLCKYFTWWRSTRGQTAHQRLTLPLLWWQD